VYIQRLREKFSSNWFRGERYVVNVKMIDGATRYLNVTTHVVKPTGNPRIIVSGLHDNGPV